MSKVIICTFAFFMIFATKAVFCQDFNKKIIENDEEILIGNCDQTAFTDIVFGNTFQEDYNSYIPDTTTIEKLSKIKDFSVTIVLASWCGDSREQLPRFLKICDEIDFSNFNLICVNRNKTIIGSEKDIEKLNVEFVPTFIVMSGDAELGRIIETPEESLEKDLLKILENQ